MGRRAAISIEPLRIMRLWLGILAADTRQSDAEIDDAMAAEVGATQTPPCILLLVIDQPTASVTGPCPLAFYF